MESLRLFIAVTFSQKLIDKIAITQKILQESYADVKWVEKENLHLTLKFLGETTCGKLDLIKKKLTEITCQPFTISLKGLGCLPNRKNPRVIYIKVDQGAEELSHFAEMVSKAMLQLGFEEEKRRFVPHLTLGRVRSLKGKDDLIKLIETLPIEELGCDKVEEFVLMQSLLTKRGPVYTPSAVFKFNG